MFPWSKTKFSELIYKEMCSSWKGELTIRSWECKGWRGIPVTWCVLSLLGRKFPVFLIQVAMVNQSHLKSHCMKTTNHRLNWWTECSKDKNFNNYWKWTAVTFLLVFYGEYDNVKSMAKMIRLKFNWCF